MSNTLGLDTATDLTRAAPALKAAGDEFVGRYGCTHTEIAGKMLTLPEACAVSNAGMKIVSIWENGSPTTLEYFSESKGWADAHDAAAFFAALGQPKGTPIYFTVDGDLPWETGGPLDLYVAGLLDVIDSGYQLGLYGSGALCAAVSENAGVPVMTWLAQSTGWSGYDAFKPKATIVQGPQKILTLGIIGTTAATVIADTDTAQVDNYGAWNIT